MLICDKHNRFVYTCLALVLISNGRAHLRLWRKSFCVWWKLIGKVEGYGENHFWL